MGLGLGAVWLFGHWGFGYTRDGGSETMSSGFLNAFKRQLLIIPRLKTLYLNPKPETLNP